VMSLPVGGYDTTSTGIDLVLRCQSDSLTLSDTLDYMQIFPATPGAFQRVNLTGNVASTDSVVVDGIEQSAYVTDTGGDHTPLVYPEGNPLLLHPGQGHRFIWCLRESTGRGSTETCALTVAYRPRRLTV
jgi:hypothetical protein